MHTLNHSFIHYNVLVVPRGDPVMYIVVWMYTKGMLVNYTVGNLWVALVTRLTCTP